MSRNDFITTRSATAGDVEATAAIGQAEQEQIRDERGGRWHLDHDQSRLGFAERHHNALGSADHHLVVGCVDDIVVGFAVAQLSPADGAVLCMIDELIVAPGARGIGVGSAMLETVREWAIEHDCAALESHVLPGNRAAKNFFERLGMKTRKMRVSTDLT